MYWTDIWNGTNNTPAKLEAADYPSTCIQCGSKRIICLQGEVCCSCCGSVLGSDYELDHASSLSKLNLFQATALGTAKVSLDIANHMHEGKDDVSRISNVCVKLDLPIALASEARRIYKKVMQEKLAESGVRCEGSRQNDNSKQRPRLKGCTKAHLAAYAVHSVCTRRATPRTDADIISAVRMEFGAKKEFTMLKAYSLLEPTSRKIGIECDFDRAEYYLKILLARLRDKVGRGPTYDRISAQAFLFLKIISDNRANSRARRALKLAIRDTGLDVQI